MNGTVNARRIIRGHDGPVEIDEARRTVTKTYLTLRQGIAAEKAKRESEYASRLFAALKPFKDLRCPRIHACELGAPPRIVMDLCCGEPLSRFLRRVGKSDSRAADIAEKIKRGLEVYVNVFDEPYYDLCFQNLLYDERLAVLTFLDFGIPHRASAPDSCSPLEVSLGSLVGWACYEMVRPARLFSRRAGYMAVMEALVAAFDGQVSKRHVDIMGRAVFARLIHSGSALRRIYYRTAGTPMKNRYLRRIRTGGALRLANSFRVE